MQFNSSTEMIQVHLNLMFRTDVQWKVIHERKKSTTNQWFQVDIQGGHESPFQKEVLESVFDRYHLYLSCWIFTLYLILRMNFSMKADMSNFHNSKGEDMWAMITTIAVKIKNIRVKMKRTKGLTLFRWHIHPAAMRCS